MNGFVHLHTHSYYSLLDGISSPEELVIAAKKSGMKALALTDHNSLYGAIEFYQTAKKYNLKPIIGAQLRISDGFDLIFLVKDDTGYRNLCNIISIGQLNGGHLKFRIDIKDIFHYKDGLIVLSGGHKGKIFHLLHKRRFDEAIEEACQLQSQFGEDFFLEMQHFSPQHTIINLRLRDISAEYKIPLAATNDVHFVSLKDWSLRRVLHAIDANTVSGKIETAGSSEQHLKSPGMMKEMFDVFPSALTNTQRIAGMCHFEFDLGKPIFPSIELPEGETGFSYLWKKSFEGATRRYKPLTREVIKRLQYELQTIHDLGFAEYFLIVKNIVDYCHKNHIPCVGRGSAADSLVSYALEITQVDPIRHNLYFERFLNPERADPPDIDLDICWKNRDRVLGYVYEKYGKDRVAMICTFNTFQVRSAIRDVAKTYGLPEDEIGKLTKHLPHRAIEQLEETINTLPELRELRHNLSLYEEIIRIAHRIADFPRHLSIHPGGVIIAPDRITNHTPLEIAGKGIVISQYDMYSIEKLGLVKMDLLGVRSLSVITDCIRAVKKKAESGDLKTVADKHKKTPDFLLKNSDELSPLDLRTIPGEDPDVTAYIRSGQTMCCFQLESPAMRGLLRKMMIEGVDDVITAVALIRPGASGSGMKEIYIKRRAGLEKTTYIHPSIAPALEETYGVTIYQEQVLRIAHLAAGLSLGQADSLRRAMTKSRNKKEFLNIHGAFIQGALKNGLDNSQADTIWQFLSQFVGYGFNKAHSATYGTIAYQTAFLKYYFPLEYMCAVLNNQGGFYSRMAYTEEARRMGLRLLTPDVNYSEADFSSDNDAIRTGLGAVFELSEKTIQSIIAARKIKSFSDIFDFIRRTRANEKEIGHLIKAGALTSIHQSAPQLLLLNRLYFKNKKKTAVVQYVAGETELEPFNDYQKIINEMEMLDFAVTDHPLALFEQNIPGDSIIPSTEIESHKGKSVTCIGWLVTSRRIATSKNQYMKFLTLEDRFGLFEVVLFPAVYNRFGHLIRTHGPYIITGKIQSRLPGEANLIVDKLEIVAMDKKEIEFLLQKKEPLEWND
ncbi:MAG: DNA polymerase III subunit alpha [Calditrichaceae bacterium]